MSYINGKHSNILSSHKKGIADSQQSSVTFQFGKNLYNVLFPLTFMSQKHKVKC